MKFFTKRLPAMMVVLSVAAVVLTSCGNVSNTNSAVTAKVVVEESIVAMENMMAQPPTVSQANVIGPQYSILPNWEVDYDQIRQNLVASSATTMYMAEYLAKNDILKEGKTYIDVSESEEGTTKFVVYMENTNEGVQIKMNNYIGDIMATDILLDFHYDYNAMQPIESIFAQFSEEGVLVTLFNYKTNEVVEFWLVVDPEMNETFKKSMEEKNMSFDKFSEYGISEYTIVKGNFKAQNIEAYKYKRPAGSEHELENPVDAETVTALFNDVYAQVKDYCKSPEVMDSTNAENRVFFEKMYEHASSKAYTLAWGVIV